MKKKKKEKHQLEAKSKRQLASELHLNTTKKLLNHAVQHYKEEELKEAEYCYRQILKSFSANADVYYNLGLILQNQGKLDEAITFYQRTLTISPNSADAHNNLGLIFGNQGKLDEAIASFQHALAINPKLDGIHNNLGLALQNKGKLEEAIASFQRALAINPNYADAYYNMGTTFQKQSNYDEAIVYFKKSIELNHNTFPVAEHMLAALTGETTKGAPREYISNLFDQYSTRYDKEVIEKLKYKVPKLLRGMLDSLFKTNVRFRNVIDLGCGTGLSGMEFRIISDRLTGIDLSNKMLEKTRIKKIYDVLQVADIVEFLNGTDEKYNLFIAAGVLDYIGDLKFIFNSVKNCSLSGAYFVFSTENYNEKNYVLRQTGRYAYSREYIQLLAKEHNFANEICKSVGILKEKREYLKGNLFVLKYIK